MVEPLRHRQTKEAATDMFYLTPPRHISTLPRLCENVHEPRMPGIVFSIAFFRHKLPVQLVSTSTKSRWKFYTQVWRGSFHTAWVRTGSIDAPTSCLLTPITDINDRPWHVRKVPAR